jgi:hypothetical protein
VSYVAVGGVQFAGGAAAKHSIMNSGDAGFIMLQILKSKLSTWNVIGPKRCVFMNRLLLVGSFKAS